jgi:hypothetical protein
MHASYFAQLRTEPRLTGRTVSLPALGLLVVFAVAAYGGANIIAFERLPGWVSSAPGQSVDRLSGPISTWKNTTGVATRARTFVRDIILAKTPGDTAAIENALDEVAKASPTSVAAWQAIVAYEAARSAPMERMLAAFRMSALTGSHEAYYMARRAIFGLEHWTDLTEADRGTVVRDLLGSAELLWREEFWISSDSYRKIIAGKSPAERDDIRAAVMASGRGTKGLLQALGL